MGFGGVLSIVWSVIAYLVMNTAAVVWVALMLPGPTQRARARILHHPSACFFLGLLVAAVTLVISLTFLSGRAGGLQLLGWILAGPALTASVVGAAAIATIVAERIRPLCRSESGMLSLVGGAACTSLASLLPVLGWFVFLPLVGLVCVGAGTLGLLSRRNLLDAPAPTPAPPPSFRPEAEFVLPTAPGAAETGSGTPAAPAQPCSPLA
jgi:hypothetical protein